MSRWYGGHLVRSHGQLIVGYAEGSLSARQAGC